MSALWDLQVQASHHHLTLTRQLELRSLPRIYRTETELYASPSSSDATRTPILGAFYRASLQSWIYSAAVELSQSAASPAWSKDTWSFIPIDTNDIRNTASLQGIKTLDLPGQPSKITFQTPALRARLQCKPLDFSTNTSNWLRRMDFNDKSLWNDTNRPPGLDHGYTLWSDYVDRGSDVGYFTCCANQTNGEPGDAAIGYWSDMGVSSGKFESSMTAKWITGRPLNGTFKTNNRSIPRPLWIWSEEPKVAAINCTPIYEQANASVSVELQTGSVQDYKILDQPQIVTSA